MNVVNTFANLQFDPLQMMIPHVSLEGIAYALSFYAVNATRSCLLFCSSTLTKLVPERLRHEGGLNG